jgi:hypothetical protein
MNSRPNGAILLRVEGNCQDWNRKSEETHLEPGTASVASRVCSLVPGTSRRLAALPRAPQVRLRVQQAIGKLLLIRLQRDQFDPVAFRVGEEAAVGADPVVRAGLENRFALQFLAGARVPHLRRIVPTAGEDSRAGRAERHGHHNDNVRMSH